MKHLIIGGAGYIGSHMAKMAIEQGHEPIIFDNLSRGHREACPEKAHLVVADILDTEKLTTIIREWQPDGIFHFAALALVNESVHNPELYWRNNVLGVKSLLDALVTTQQRPCLVFSSSCAVFGIPETNPIHEQTPKNPISPYGTTKLAAELLINDYATRHNIPAVALRYFNACGAAADASIGEDHQPETHLIPTVMQSILAHKPFKIFGGDYPTPDGSCIRDYIHVLDLAQAHLQAVDYLKTQAPNGLQSFHLGSGIGFSNLEIVKKIEEVTQREAHYTISERREGDPAKLVADITKAKTMLKFSPKFSDLDHIIGSAWHWHHSHPQGFASH